MKKIILLLVALPIFSVTLMATAPTLPTKDLSTSPVIGSSIINYAAGTRNMNDDVAFSPTGNYTVEVKAKLLSTALKGLVLEARNSARVGFRIAINSNGIENLGALNYANEIAATNLNALANDASTYHTFRFAVEGTNVHIYRDGVYITTTTTEGIYNDDLLKDNNGNFESADVSMWNFVTAGQGLTTAVGEFRTGNAALKLVNVGTTTVQSSLTIKGLKPTTTYALSFYAKYLSKTVNKGNMRYELKLGGYDGADNFVKNSSTTNNNIVSNPTNSMDPTLATWTLNGNQFTTGATDSVAVLDISGWNGDNTYVIDDMVLYEVEATPTTGAAVAGNLVTNGDFATDAAGWSAGAWPLGAVAWTATTDELSNPIGGQLQIKEATWANNSIGTYKHNIDVMPNKTYISSAKISHKFIGARFLQLVDGTSYASTSYDVVAAVAPATNLTTYYNLTTPAITTGPATTSLSLQFNAKAGHVGTPTVVATLDDVVLQEYEASFPSYLSYGKAYQSEASNFDIAYINYDLTGAYAPQNVSTGVKDIVNNLSLSSLNGTLKVSGIKAGQTIEVFNCVGIKLAELIAHEGENQLPIRDKGVIFVKSGNSTAKIIL